jgi:hypothetical protein
MRVKIAIAGREHEGPAQLKGILATPGHGLAMAAFLGPRAGGHVVGTKDMKQVGSPQSSHAISNALFIDEQRKCDAGLLSEEAAIFLAAQPDGGNADSFMVKLPLVLAQLRDMLAAVDSTIVPQKNDNGRHVGPDSPQPNLIPFGIGQTDAGQLCTQ